MEVVVGRVKSKCQKQILFFYGCTRIALSCTDKQHVDVKCNKWACTCARNIEPASHIFREPPPVLPHPPPESAQREQNTTGVSSAHSFDREIRAGSFCPHHRMCLVFLNSHETKANWVIVLYDRSSPKHESRK